MAEAVGLAGSIIAVVQLADSIVRVCKLCIEGLKDCPHYIRTILIEILPPGHSSIVAWNFSNNMIHSQPCSLSWVAQMAL